MVFHSRIITGFSENSHEKYISLLSLGIFHFISFFAINVIRPVSLNQVVVLPPASLIKTTVFRQFPPSPLGNLLVMVQIIILHSKIKE